MSLPDELFSRITEHIPIEHQLKFAMTSVVTRNQFCNDLFWKKQCDQLSFKGPVKSSNLPISHAPIINCWRKRFHDHFITQNHWSSVKYRRHSLNSDDQICLLLDGDQGKALSSHLPNNPKNTHFWDLESGMNLFNVNHEMVVLARMNGNQLIMGLHNGELVLRDIREVSAHTCITGAHLGEITAISVLNGTMATGSFDKTVRLWDMRNLNVHSQQLICPSAVTSIHIGEGEIFCGCLDGSLLLLNKKGSSQLRRFSAAINCIEGNEQEIFFGLDNGSLFRSSNDDLMAVNISNSSPVVAMHASSQRLVLGHSDGKIDYIPFTTAKEGEIKSISESRGIIWQVYSDTARIISSSLDRRLIIHDFGPTKYYKF